MRPSVAILRTQSDQRLVALAREGHDAAFTAIVERYRRPMLAACRRFLPEARAEDAVQQTFVAAWKALRRGDEVQELRPWLYRIARNTALNALRAPGYDVVELQESLRFGEAPQDELERREAMRRTLAGLAALPERQREALLRAAIDGTPHADIARDLGLSEGAARQLVMRARTTLRTAASAVLPFPLLQWLVASAGPTATLAKAGAVAAVAGASVATPIVVVEERKREPAPQQARTASKAPSFPARTPAAEVAARSDVADELVAVTPARARRSAPPKRAVPAAPRPAQRRRSNRGPGGGGGSHGIEDDDEVVRELERERDDDDDDRSGSNSGPSGGGDDVRDDDDDVRVETVTDNSGSGSSGSGTDNSGSGSSGSGGDDLDDADDSSGSGSSGSGGDDSDEPDVEDPDD